MNPKDVVIDRDGTLGPPPYWLCNITEDWEYVDNKKTDVLLGYKYYIAVPRMNLDKIPVKIPGKKRIEHRKGEVLEVNFTDFELQGYVARGEYGLSGKASGISLANEKKG